jgi:hypothetical protein
MQRPAAQNRAWEAPELLDLLDEALVTPSD